ncbi:MAG: alpha-1,4-glucan--maltose-1-phosphate maltosyltransferase [Acidobacteria bacterium]|nr:alpha-1,4-glucan--maltose-1-phosphate maltosyltransferase [Acidobacteriota bacterium]
MDSENRTIINSHPPRPVIENVEPEIEAGRFPAKRILNDKVNVRADIHADAHDLLAAAVLYRKAGEEEWSESPMTLLVNDRWEGSFVVSQLGLYEFTIEAWIDRFASWKSRLLKKVAAGQEVSQDLLIGAELIRHAADRASREDSLLLQNWAESLSDPRLNLPTKTDLVSNSMFDLLMGRYPDRSASASYDRILTITVDPEIARFSSWYEMFPRSASAEPGKHGTFRDCRKRLPYIAGMGFNVLYLPPIHPIGRTHRKGRNNTLQPDPDAPGSPWAIGSDEGGHTAIHPQLGSMDDFRDLIRKARETGIEVALDLAFQCSPDHPWIKEHPGWFRRRPDGSIQHAENPPKIYEDIVPLDFETDDWKALYKELFGVVMLWIAQGVRVFRVDNPHTKPYSFWEWLIREVKQAHPEVIFLSEAFTRPKVMYRLAKIGFSQSYTYFTWRHTSHELRTYLTELTRPPLAEYFRPNLWPNTPDILPVHLQFGGRPAFQMRLILAATLGSNYGIYGPAFELCENTPIAVGKEEYLDSEKYEIRHWNLQQSGALSPIITRINTIRRENPALQSDRNLRFHEVSNDQLLAYSKHTDDLSNIILTVVNLDADNVQSGFIKLPMEELNITTSRPFQVHDLLSARRYLWSGTSHYVEINPHSMPAHVFRLRRYVRSEKDFDYYL